jgi:arabinan endo-1,5-alpha-L-arabinosidase
MRFSALFALAACSGGPSKAAPDGPAGGPQDASSEASSDAPAACATRISYGDTWIHPAGHPDPTDMTAGVVTWDGSCVDDGTSSYAVLSNGWRPYFAGHTCAIALDHPGCGPSACTTRITYGSAWLPPANHPDAFDDVAGRVFWDGDCAAAGGDSVATLSNGWAPHFAGASSCGLSQRWEGCGGLYQNAVLPNGCADPGVTRDGNRYLMTCTSGGAANAFPIYESTDLVSWTLATHIFSSATKPAWATGDFWAPELHPIGSTWVAYFSARNTDGKLSIGAAWATDPLGPYTPLPQPLVHDPNMGLIDASEFTDTDGTPYLLWKEDGNAVGQHTPIHAQPLAADGLSLTGARSTLITNDQAWEGAVTEGPFMIEHAGAYYLFYSGNSYANATYAVGVAKASSPTGPFTKAAGPIVTTSGAWVGPGHNSVVTGPGGDAYLVYHAWKTGHVNGAGDARYPLVDQIVWRNGWPAVPGAPSTASRPLP